MKIELSLANNSLKSIIFLMKEIKLNEDLTKLNMQFNKLKYLNSLN